MPRMNQTGPIGQGPMTGRRMGRCAGNTTFAKERFGFRRYFRSSKNSLENLKKEEEILTNELEAIKEEKERLENE